MGGAVVSYRQRNERVGDTMRKVRCYECGKTYDYDTDDFCPKCGAFNQPPKSTTIDANGAVIRVDGINERGHAGSFVHEELHEENRERKRMGLSKGIRRTAAAASQPSAQRPASRQSGRQSGKAQPAVGKLIFWIFAVIIGLNILSSLFGFLLMW